MSTTVNDKEKDVVIAILAKDKEPVLSFFLDCIYKQTYPKKNIHLYIRTNDNRDNTERILTNFIEKYGDEYASVWFDASSISEQLKQYSSHEWNPFRFNLLGKIRQDSIEYAKNIQAHYFVVDCDNFLIPITLEKMMKNRMDGVVSPMLRTWNKVSKPFYSNFHYSVNNNGYYSPHDYYYFILQRKIIGRIEVKCVHCTYFIPNPYLPFIKYIDGSERYEYVIFSDGLRKKNIPQYIDNTHQYGYLTFVETSEAFEKEFKDLSLQYSFNLS